MLRVIGKSKLFRGALMALPAIIWCFSSFAEDTAASNAIAINTMWTLLAAFLVFFMQAGFAMVEAGFTRAKNAGNIMMKNLMDFAVGTLAFFAVGYAFMFGKDAGGFIGIDGFFMSGFDPSTPDGMWTFAFWIFQAVFAATAATIVSGAMAERTKFSSYMVYSVFITAFIYPVVGHWIWGGGWLSKMGMIDFAGSSVVHSVGAWTALAGAIVLGPRLGKYNSDGSSNVIAGHNIPLAALGVFILWFGWFGFNAGSTTAGTDLSIAIIAVTTNLAAAAGALVATAVVWLQFGKPDVSMSLNGALAGLVAITAGCANVSPGAAILIGAIAGALVVFSVEIIDKVFRIDDPVGAVSVHGVCGAFGTLAVGLFANPAYGAKAGLLYGGGLTILKTQAIGVLSVFVWSFLGGLLLFTTIKFLIGLRVSDDEQIKGLDICEHGMESYSGFQIFSTEN